MLKDSEKKLKIHLMALRRRRRFIQRQSLWIVIGRFVQSFHSFWKNKKRFWKAGFFLCIFQDTPFTILFLFFQREGMVNIASKASLHSFCYSYHEKITSLTIQILVSLIIGPDADSFTKSMQILFKNIGDFLTGCLKVNFYNWKKTYNAPVWCEHRYP